MTCHNVHKRDVGTGLQGTLDPARRPNRCSPGRVFPGRRKPLDIEPSIRESDGGSNVDWHIVCLANCKVRIHKAAASVNRYL